jgi:DNA polymerase (family X)
MNKVHRYTNREIAQILFEMAAYWDMQKIDYKKRAYELAGTDVSIHEDEIAGIYEKEGVQGLTKISSVGPRIAKHIKELLTTGKFQEYEEFRRKIPVNLKELLLLPGVGPRTILELWLRLKVTNLEELEAACRAGRVRDLPRFGVKSETKMLQAIENIRTKNKMA